MTSSSGPETNDKQYVIGISIESTVKFAKMTWTKCDGPGFMFHFMFVHYTFSSVWVAEWPPFGK